MRILVVALLGCHHAPAPVVCPGPAAIVPGTCTAAPATTCRGVCGVVVRTSGCTPLNATVFIDGVNLAVGTDADGRFDFAPIPPGHYKGRVMAGQDDGLFELDVTGEPQPLPAPLEIRIVERACGCGGDCFE